MLAKCSLYDYQPYHQVAGGVFANSDSWGSQHNNNDLLNLLESMSMISFEDEDFSSSNHSLRSIWSTHH